MKQSHQVLRVATYNIHKCRGLDCRVHPKRILDVLQHINADIIALQEVLNSVLIILLVLVFGAGGGYYGDSRWGPAGGAGSADVTKIAQSDIDALLDITCVYLIVLVMTAVAGNERDLQFP